VIISVSQRRASCGQGGKKQREEANMIVLALLLTRRLQQWGGHQLKPHDKKHKQSVDVDVYQARPPHHEPKRGNRRMIILPLLLVPNRKGQLKGKDENHQQPTTRTTSLLVHRPPRVNIQTRASTTASTMMELMMTRCSC
jgi:hypothetical protein